MHFKENKWKDSSCYSLPETTYIAPKNRPGPKRKFHLPTIHFQGRAAGFGECRNFRALMRQPKKNMSIVQIRKTHPNNDLCHKTHGKPPPQPPKSEKKIFVGKQLSPTTTVIRPPEYLSNFFYDADGGIKAEPDTSGCVCVCVGGLVIGCVVVLSKKIKPCMSSRPLK